MNNPDEERKIIIDEDWKAQVQAEKEAAAKSESETAESETAESEPAPDATASSAAGEQPMPSLPSASFAEVATMFATQASMSLQQAADPQGEERGDHLAYAKHFIDLLAVVEEKTKGNLTDEEAKMLDGFLHELRMAYVSLNRQ